MVTREARLTAAVVLLLAPVLYDAYWATKHVSYAWFYCDMVEGTVRSMVKGACLADPTDAGNQ